MIADLLAWDDDVPIEVRKAVTGHLGGELFHASEDMAALAVAAGQELDTIRFATEDRITPMGLLVMSGGIGRYTTAEGVDCPVDAVSWGPSDHGSTLLVVTWTERQRMVDALTERGGSSHRLDAAPALVSGLFQGLLVGVDECPVAELPAQLSTVLRALFAAWQLMAQPTISDRTAAPMNRGIARSYARAGRPRPEVTLVSLRHIYRSDPTDDSTDRQYRHRWVVRGHWRQQTHGPQHSLRRRTWIPAYVKGPDGAPLLARERVNVWRR